MSDRLSFRERQALDRWITGNYGEDQIKEEDSTPDEIQKEEFPEEPDDISDNDYGPDNSDIEDDFEPEDE